MEQTRSLRRGAGGRPHAAKAIDVVSETDIGVAWTLVITIAGAAILRAKSPGAPANHFVWTLTRSSGIFWRRLLVIVHLVKVVAPLPQVAAHVIKSPRIGLFLTNWPGMATRIFVKPGIVPQFRRADE